ncbi:hypothetical protein CC2G_001938 [Coprinopsis cinerea AmutBmut pab1-1]|nr:hypothetical protein CC2G_001938 [Coprinopsis cinerea AmutBmut pab1-1]
MWDANRKPYRAVLRLPCDSQTQPWIWISWFSDHALPPPKLRHPRCSFIANSCPKIQQPLIPASTVSPTLHHEGQYPVEGTLSASLVVGS